VIETAAEIPHLDNEREKNREGTSTRSPTKQPKINKRKQISTKKITYSRKKKSKKARKQERGNNRIGKNRAEEKAYHFADSSIPAGCLPKRHYSPQGCLGHQC
jgi:hypothetical protein